MTTQLSSNFSQATAAESSNDDWVLRISIGERGTLVPHGVSWAERGSLRCFFHGLLFDRELLADSNDSDPLQASDAVLVLKAYEREGRNIFPRLRGSFVVAIIDATHDLAIVLRDPLGSHPLFYAKVGFDVLFASAPELLLDQPGISRRLNRAALADHLCHRWPDPQETFFADVHRVPAGWQAVVSSQRLHLERYWHPVPTQGPISWLSIDEALRFDEVFDRAVDRCLSNGPAGIFLSGGLDSISVAAFATDRARKNGQSPPWALSIAFPAPECDERVVQSSVARELGIPQHLVDFYEAVGSRAALERSIALNRDSSAPVMNTYHPAYQALARRARLDGVRTILTGQGGDEWLTMSPFLAADLIRGGAVVELTKLFGVLRRSNRQHPLWLARNLFWTCGLRQLAALALNRLVPTAHNASRLRRILAADPPWISPDQELRSEQGRRVEATLTPYEPSQGFYLRELRAGLDHTLTSWELEEQYERGKRIGVRFLHPFWDPDVVEMLCRMPFSVLNAGGRSKGIIRKTLARRFPTLGLDRQRKVLAGSFFQSLLAHEGPSLAEMAGDFPALSTLGIVDGPATREAVCSGLKERLGPYGVARIFHTINLEMWVRWHS
jgi:asparagine synthetase B (glutamine-hydrolysing)